MRIDKICGNRIILNYNYLWNIRVSGMARKNLKNFEICKGKILIFLILKGSGCKPPDVGEFFKYKVKKSE